MLSPDDIPNLDARVRILQIVTVALVSGAVLFGLIVLFGLGALNAAPNGIVFSAMGSGFAALMFVVHLVAPPIVARSMIQKNGGPSNVEGLLDAYQQKHVVGLAVLEGAAFLNFVACITEHQPWTVATAGALVMIMMTHFPTQSRVLDWIQTQQMSDQMP